MSLEDFDLVDKETTDYSNINRNFLKNYHQQAAKLNDFDQNIEFISGKNDNCHQIGTACLPYEMTVENMLLMQLTEVFQMGMFLISKKRFCIMLQRS